MPDTKLVKNAAGRMVPTEVNGNEAVPYQGVGEYRPRGNKAAPAIATVADYPDCGDKTVPNLKAALKAAGLKDGMTISTHHHLRNGDFVGNAVFDAAAELGAKDLMWFPSASFPCHAPITRHMESGVVHPLWVIIASIMNPFF